MLLLKCKKIVLSLVFMTLIGASVPLPSLAQDQQQLLLAAPLLHGSVRNVSAADVDVFVSLQKLIQHLNLATGAPYLYANPQMGSPNEIGAWTLNNNVDIAMLTYPMYAAIDAIGLSKDFTPVASVAAFDSVILGNASACAPGHTLTTDITQGLFITRNEYSSNGKLLADVLFSRMGALPAIRYSGENLDLAINRFALESNSSRPTLFLINTVDSDPVLKQVPGSCVLQKNIITPWPATVVVVRKDIPADKLKLLQAGVVQLSQTRDTVFPKMLRTTMQNLLSEQFGHFTLLNGPSDPELKAAQDIVRKAGVDLRAFFSISQLMLRLDDWVKEGTVAFILTSADSRTAYSLGAASQVMLEVNKQPDIAKHIFLEGTSGGALGSLIFTLVPNFGSYDAAKVQAVVDPNKLLDPAIRFKLFSFFVEWKYVLLAFLILMLAILFHSPILLWKQTLPIKQQFIWFGTAIVALALAVAFSPPLSLEVGSMIVCVAFITMIILRILSNHLEIGPRTYILGVFILAVSLVTMRSFIYRVALLDDLNIESNMRTLAQMEPELQPCAQLSADEAFSECLYTHIKYPFVVSTSDITSNQQVFFYAQPPGTNVIRPPRNNGKWVNIATCPEKMLRIVAGSASFPFIFPPSTFNCAGENFKLLDGAIFSSGTTNVATSLGAETAVTFLNEPFTVQDILKVSVQNISQDSIVSFMGGVLRVIFGFNYYRDFQQNLSDIRQVIYTPPANGFVLPNYQYFGMVKDGVNYTQEKIFEMGQKDVMRKEDGLFVQLTGNRFTFDSFANRLTENPLQATTTTASAPTP